MRGAALAHVPQGVDSGRAHVPQGIGSGRRSADAPSRPWAWDRVQVRPVKDIVVLRASLRTSTRGVGRRRRSKSNAELAHALQGVGLGTALVRGVEDIDWRRCAVSAVGMRSSASAGGLSRPVRRVDAQGRGLAVM